MSVLIVSKNDAELRLVKEMIDIGQELLKMNDKRREELRQLHVPMDVNIIFKRLIDEQSS